MSESFAKVVPIDIDSLLKLKVNWSAIVEKKKHGHWKTQEGLIEIKKLASLCDNKTEFRKKYNAAYLAAHTQGVLDEVCQHMSPIRRKKGYWNTEEGLNEIKSKANLCTQRREFENKFSAHYNAALRLGIMDEVCIHMTSPQEKSGYWGSHEGMQRVKLAVSQCSDRKEFREKFPTEYNGAIKWGYLNDVCQELDYVAYPANFWDSEEGIAEMSYCVAQCETLHEFRKRFSRAYNSAKKKGLLEKFQDDLSRLRTQKGYWDSEDGRKKIGELANNFTTRSAFKYEHPELYLAARKGGFLDNICAHMDYGGGGFNSTAKGYYYILSINLPEISSNIIKLGITNLTAKRRYEFEKASIRFLHEWEFEIGANARDAETTIKRMLQDNRYYPQSQVLTTGGDSELFKIELDTEIGWISRMLEDYAGERLY